MKNSNIGTFNDFFPDLKKEWPKREEVKECPHTLCGKWHNNGEDDCLECQTIKKNF